LEGIGKKKEGIISITGNCSTKSLKSQMAVDLNKPSPMEHNRKQKVHLLSRELQGKHAGELLNLASPNLHGGIKGKPQKSS
jgi:hypothetical protein